MSAIATRALDTAENLTGILRDHQEDFTTPRIGDVVGPDIAEQGMRAARGRQSDGRLWFLDVLSRPDAHITTLLRNPASYSQYFTQRGAEADTGIVAFPTRVDGVTVEVYIEAGSVIAQTLVIQ